MSDLAEPLYRVIRINPDASRDTIIGNLNFQDAQRVMRELESRLADQRYVVEPDDRPH